MLGISASTFSSAAVAKVTRAVRAGRDRQAHAQAGDGVQPVDRRAAGRCRLRIEGRRRQRAVAPDEGAPVGHAVDRQHLRIDRGHEMRRRHHRIAVQARLARAAAARASRAPSGFRRTDWRRPDAPRRPCGLESTGSKYEMSSSVRVSRPVLCSATRAQLGVVLRADQHRGACLQAGSRCASNCTWSARKRAR